VLRRPGNMVSRWRAAISLPSSCGKLNLSAGANRSDNVSASACTGRNPHRPRNPHPRIVDGWRALSARQTAPGSMRDPSSVPSWFFENQKCVRMSLRCVVILRFDRVGSATKGRGRRVWRNGEIWTRLEPSKKTHRKQMVTKALRSQLRVICATPVGKQAS